MRSRRKRVLITGGAGFIGSHLAEVHVHDGDEVTVLDDFSSGTCGNIAELQKAGGLQVRRGCVTDLAVLKELIPRADLVYHLAAVVGVRQNIEDPIRAMRTHLIGTEHLLSVAVKYKVRTIVTSSSEVYGNRKNMPFAEDDYLAIGPPHITRFAYGCAKAADEFLSCAYYSKEALPVTVLRLFNVTGPRQSAEQGMVLPRFIAQAALDHPLTVYGTGRQRRTFCYVSDAAQAIVAIARHPDAIGQIYNIGAEEEVSMLQLAGLVLKASKSKSSIIRIPYSSAFPPGFAEISRRMPDLSKLRKLIPDFCPRPVHQTIERMVQEHITK